MASEAGKPEPRPRRWVALASIPVVNGANDKGTEATGPDTADLMRLELHHPPRASYLALPERLAPDTSRRERNNFFPRVMAAGSDRFLVFATKGRADADYFLCDVMAGTATRLPAVPLEMGLKLLPRRSIGVVADPRRPGHAMIAQLHANVMTKARHDALLCYSTATGQWAVKPLKSSPDHERWGAHGVFAHDGLLWWVDIAHGILVCDPFDDDETPHLCFVPLPEQLTTRKFLDERRCIRPSEGKLRYVEIRGFSNNDDTAATANEPPSSPAIWIWTLVDPNGTSPWKREYEALFADIWDDDSYTAAGLPHGKVPKLAFVDPNNHRVVYFFQDASLFGLDVRARRVVACEECFVDPVVHDLRFQCSGFIDAWVLPLPPRGDHASSDGGSGTKGQDVTTGCEDELASLLNQMEINGQNSSNVNVSQTLDRDGALSHPVFKAKPDASHMCARISLHTYGRRHK